MGRSQLRVDRSKQGLEAQGLLSPDGRVLSSILQVPSRTVTPGGASFPAVHGAIFMQYFPYLLTNSKEARGTKASSFMHQHHRGETHIAAGALSPSRMGSSAKLTVLKIRS